MVASGLSGTSGLAVNSIGFGCRRHWCYWWRSDCQEVCSQDWCGASWICRIVWMNWLNTVGSCGSGCVVDCCCGRAVEMLCSMRILVLVLVIVVMSSMTADWCCSCGCWCEELSGGPVWTWVLWRRSCCSAWAVEAFLSPLCSQERGYCFGNYFLKEINGFNSRHILKIKIKSLCLGVKTLINWHVENWTF